MLMIILLIIAFNCDLFIFKKTELNSVNLYEIYKKYRFFETITL